MRLEAPTGARSEIPRLEVTFDATGFPIEQRYLNLWGDPQYDAEGKFGERFVHSPEGLILRRADIGANGDEITLRTGLRAVAFSYDRDHRLIRQTLIGADDKPPDGLENFAYLLIEYDD